MRALFLAVALLAGIEAKAAEPVDLALALAIDISGSIDPDEAKLQRQGYVDAFRHPQVIEAIVGGGHGRIAVAYFEWASNWDQRMIADWHLVDGPGAAFGFASVLEQKPISIGQRTSISGAIDFAMPMFARVPYEPARRVLDISGDGPNNDGAYVTLARDRAAAAGLVINGLPIINDRPNRWGFPTMPDLDVYYENCVIAGAGAFVVKAEDFASFGAAVRRKLILEIAGHTPEKLRRDATRGLRPPAGTSPIRRVYEGGCDIGERQSREYFQRRFGID